MAIVNKSFLSDPSLKAARETDMYLLKYYTQEASNSSDPLEKDRCLDHIVEIYCKTGDFKNATVAAKQMSSPGNALSKIDVREYLARDFWAYKTLAFQKAAALEGPDREQCLKEVAIAFAKTGEYDVAFAAAEKMISSEATIKEIESIKNNVD